MLRPALLAAVVMAAFAMPDAAEAQDRYSLAGGCWSLHGPGGEVGKTADGGYRAGGSLNNRKAIRRDLRRAHVQ